MKIGATRLDAVQGDVRDRNGRDQRAGEAFGQPLAVDQLGQLVTQRHEGTADAVLPAEHDPVERAADPPQQGQRQQEGQAQHRRVTDDHPRGPSPAVALLGHPQVQGQQGDEQGRREDHRGQQIADRALGQQSHVHQPVTQDRDAEGDRHQRVGRYPGRVQRLQPKMNRARSRKPPTRLSDTPAITSSDRLRRKLEAIDRRAPTSRHRPRIM